MGSNSRSRLRRELNASPLASADVIDHRLREVYLALVGAVGNASATELDDADTSKKAWALFKQCYRRKFSKSYRLRTIAQLKFWAGISEGDRLYSEPCVQREAMNSMRMYFAWLYAIIKIACRAEQSKEYISTSLLLANIQTE